MRPSTDTNFAMRAITSAQPAGRPFFVAGAKGTMPKTIDERLDSVQAAIEEIESAPGDSVAGQEVEIRGRTIRRPELSVLYREERRLLRLKKRKSRGGVRVRRGVPLDA